MVYRKSPFSLTSEEMRVGALLLFLAYSTLRTLSSYIGLDINLVGYVIVFIMYGLFGLSLVLCKPSGFKEAVLLLVAIVLVLTFSMIVFPENGNVFNKGFGLQHGPIIILFICSIHDIKKINKCIITHAYLSIIQMTFGLITYIRNGGYWFSTFEGYTKYANYNMSVGYYATFVALIFIQEYIKDKRLYKLILSVFLVAISVIFGARGSVLCYIVFAFLSLRRFKLNKKQFVLLFFIILAALMIYTVGINNIISYIVKILQKYGLESRTLNQLLLGSSASVNSSGRDELWGILINKISERPLIGYGVFGEQHFFEEIYGSAFYAHNIILELFVSFGVPIGIVLIVLLIRNSLKAKSIFQNTELDISYVALLAYNTGNLMVSNSFWYSTNFWIMIALIVIALRRRDSIQSISENVDN